MATGMSSGSFARAMEQFQAVDPGSRTRLAAERNRRNRCSSNGARWSDLMSRIDELTDDAP